MRFERKAKAEIPPDVSQWIASTTAEIMKREGEALVFSARELDEVALAADIALLGAAIGNALIDAFAAGSARAMRHR